MSAAKTLLEDYPSSDSARRERVAVWRGVRRLLAIRMDNIGDLLMTTPALAAAASTNPDMRITLLGGSAAAACAPHLAMVHETLTARVPWVKHEDGEPADDDLLLAARLAQRQFDAAVIFTVCTQSALPAAMVCRFAGIPLRLAHVRENPYGVLTDWARDPAADVGPVRHEVRRQLDLVSSVGWRCQDERLRFALRASDVANLETHLAPYEIYRSNRPLIVVNVGATAPSRRWPAERFGSVADEIEHVTGAAIVFTGTLEEIPLVEAARRAMHRRSLSLAGQLTLGELGALLQRACLVITANSGPVHLAAAVGTPVVDVYALTNLQHTPWQVDSRVLSHDVPCRNCLQSRCPHAHHPCMRGVREQAVVDAAVDLLKVDAANQQRVARAS